MIVREKYLIPAVLTVGKDVEDNITSRLIHPEIDQVDLPVLSYLVLKKTWVDDKMYLEVEIVFDELDRAVIEAKGWQKI